MVQNQIGVDIVGEAFNARCDFGMGLDSKVNSKLNSNLSIQD